MRHCTVLSIVVTGVVTAALAVAPTALGAAPSTAVAQAATPSTTTATIDVKPVVGSQALAISGTAPAGQEVRVTLYVTLSRDIPDVMLSSKTIRSNAQGAYATSM